jgi:DNA (cytosine-5)-methyltransferase 1
MGSLRAAEFFAGIGLMRSGLASGDIETVWANDIEASKREMYVANFGDGEFVFGDVRAVTGDSLPEVDIATASFPCTDLSLAGGRRGLGKKSVPAGSDGGSSMFWEFARVLGEMGESRPPVLLLENVLGFATSHGGRDLTSALRELNRLGYSCDVMALDARHFVPQSRPRMFIVGLAEVRPDDRISGVAERPEWVRKLGSQRSLRLHARKLPELPVGPTTLEGTVERLPAKAPEWWEPERVARFASSLSPIQTKRLKELRSSDELVWRTAYRRTRGGKAVWEIRSDGIAGCLRTARGGSSKQALVEAGKGKARVRWLTPREYARLMGAPDFKLHARANQSLFGFGDAVCVPVIAYLARHYLAPAAQEQLSPSPDADTALAA